MSAQPTRAQRYLAILDRLAEQGADLATRLHEQSLEPVEPGALLAKLGAPATVPIITAEMIAAFDQIARAIRRTILLAQRLAEPPTIPLAATRSPNREPENASEPPDRDPASIDPVRTERPERPECLDPPDNEDEIANRPAPDIIAEINHDLGHISEAKPHLFARPPVPTSRPANPNSFGNASDAETVALILDHAPPNPPRRRT